MKRIAPVIALLLLTSSCLTSCASYHVQRGAAIGALTGAALGATAGEIISDPKVLGSRDSERRGNTELPQGQTILASLAIGVLVGGIVGAMVGHQRDDGFEGKPPPPEPPSASASDQDTAALVNALPARLTKL